MPVGQERFHFAKQTLFHHPVHPSVDPGVEFRAGQLQVDALHPEGTLHPARSPKRRIRLPARKAYFQRACHAAGILQVHLTVIHRVLLGQQALQGLKSLVFFEFRHLFPHLRRYVGDVIQAVFDGLQIKPRSAYQHHFPTTRMDLLRCTAKASRS